MREVSEEQSGFEADRLAPKNAKYLTNIGNALVMQRRCEETVKACTLAIAADPASSSRSAQS
jgi:hypothetical protein